MSDHWRRIPALLAGAGVLAAALYAVGLPTPSKVDAEHLSVTRWLAWPGLPTATRPSEALARAVERTARGALPEPYFLDRREAARFRDRWQGRLVEGRALVARADAFDAGTAHGHRIPVEIWLDGGDRVMGLAGEVTFEPQDGGPRLRTVDLRPIDLAVSTWAEAEERLRRTYPVAGEPTAGAAPFYGLFRFRLGDQRWAVDARTGEVVPE